MKINRNSVFKRNGLCFILVIENREVFFMVFMKYKFLSLDCDVFFLKFREFINVLWNCILVLDLVEYIN